MVTSEHNSQINTGLTGEIVNNNYTELLPMTDGFELQPYQAVVLKIQ